MTEDKYRRAEALITMIGELRWEIGALTKVLEKGNYQLSINGTEFYDESLVVPVIKMMQEKLQKKLTSYEIEFDEL